MSPDCFVTYVPDRSALQEAFSYNMGNKDKREVKRIVFEYFEFIEKEWNKFLMELKK
jgi:hypothetical protein